MSESIQTKVHDLCDEIIAGRVCDELLKKHKISKEYLVVCGDQIHPSCEKMRKRLFESYGSNWVLLQLGQ